MFPISLNLAVVPIFLTGEGEAFDKRKKQLLEMGAKNFVETIEDAVVVMVAGLDHSSSGIIAAEARKQKKLVNVEDVNDLCDFYFMAHVQRGDLIIAISTNGASPTLAKHIRDDLATRFGAQWKTYTEEIKQFRLQQKAQGKSMKETMQATDAFLVEKGWLA